MQKSERKGHNEGPVWNRGTQNRDAFKRNAALPSLLASRGAQFIFPLFLPSATAKRASAATCSAGFFCFFRSKASRKPNQTGPQ